MHAFILAKRILDGRGNLHGIVGKTTAAASTFLMVAPNRTLAPYLPLPAETVAQFRNMVETDFTDLLRQG